LKETRTKKSKQPTFGLNLDHYLIIKIAKKHEKIQKLSKDTKAINLEKSVVFAKLQKLQNMNTITHNPEVAGSNPAPATNQKP